MKKFFMKIFWNSDGRKSNDSNRVLVFPKGAIVKFDGLPCELLQDTAYECETIRARSRN